jgi:hypothetical protein
MISEAQLSICRRAAALECQLESMEGKMSASQPIDVGQYARLSGVLCRMLDHRLVKPIDPQGELVRAMQAYLPTAIDDDDDDGDEPLPIELRESGASALALALSAPPTLPLPQEIVVVTFGVVAFSIIVQGLTMPLLLRRLGFLPK